jgi:hypothetical protein
LIGVTKLIRVSTQVIEANVADPVVQQQEPKMGKANAYKRSAAYYNSLPDGGAAIRAKLAERQARQRKRPRGIAALAKHAQEERERTLARRAAALKADPTLKLKPTKAEREARRDAVQTLIESMEHPVTLRQVYYRAVVKGIVKKTLSGYQTIGHIVTALRENEDIPWDWITDNTRRVIQYRMFANAAEALRHCADTFTRDPWCDAKVTVSIWMEKDALAGVLQLITLPLGVPLFILKGNGGLSFIKKAADRFNDADRPVYCYHLGDFDPSGQRAGKSLERRLNEFCTVPVHFHSLALSPTQIKEWELQSRETKISDNNLEWFVREFGTDRRIRTLDRDLARFTDNEEKRKYLLELSPESVELDAIEPDQLRTLVRDAIMQHTSAKRIKANEKIEKQISDRLLSIAEDEEL